MLIIPHLVPIAKLISKKKEGYKCISTILLPVVERLLMSEVQKISIDAAAVLADIAGILNDEDRDTYLLAIILSKSFV